LKRSYDGRSPETSDHHLINTTVLEVNGHVSFEPLDSTFTFSPDPTSCPASFVGIFGFEARLTNISEHSLAAPVVQVRTLTTAVCCTMPRAGWGVLAPG
jgi:hypothetical protein